MLHYSTVEPRTLEILRTLMGLPALSNFYLAGGTALSLYYGHRLSIDLDLFSQSDFKTDVLAKELEVIFPSFSYALNTAGIFGFIGNVKVDFVKHYYFDLISPIQSVEGIRLYGEPDIAAMKIAAILKRGVKKDFWDIAEMLQKFSLAELISFYEEKYPSQQLLISVPQALIYFDDAEESVAPVSLTSQDWESVKQVIREKVREYLT